jgi:hypothetical protein
MCHPEHAPTAWSIHRACRSRCATASLANRQSAHLWCRQEEKLTGANRAPLLLLLRRAVRRDWSRQAASRLPGRLDLQAAVRLWPNNNQYHQGQTCGQKPPSTRFRYDKNLDGARKGRKDLP